MALPLMITGLGIESDNLGDEFMIYFFSVFNARKLYLGDGMLTEDRCKAIKADSASFATEELGKLLGDDEFMNYLEMEMVF